MQNTLISSQTKDGIQLNTTLSIGAAQPPKNMIAVRKAMMIMFEYSASMNWAKAMPEYSTMWPATISDSPSTTSKGERLVSATPDTKYTTSIGASGNQFQDRKLRPLSATLT